MTKQSTKDFFKEYRANNMNPAMIHSMAFGRAFWLDDNDEFCSAPWRQDGTVDMEQQDYVSEWNDLEGVSLDKLFTIHRNLVKGNGYHKIEVGQNITAIVDAVNADKIKEQYPFASFANEITKEQIKAVKGTLL